MSNFYFFCSAGLELRLFSATCRLSLGSVWDSHRLLHCRIQSIRSGPGIQTCRPPSAQWRFLCLRRPRRPLLDWLFHFPTLLQELGPYNRVTPQVGRTSINPTTDGVNDMEVFNNNERLETKPDCQCPSGGQRSSTALQLQVLVTQAWKDAIQSQIMPCWSMQGGLLGSSSITMPSPALPRRTLPSTTAPSEDQID